MIFPYFHLRVQKYYEKRRINVCFYFFVVFPDWMCRTLLVSFKRGFPILHPALIKTLGMHYCQYQRCCFLNATFLYFKIHRISRGRYQTKYKFDCAYCGIY
ncbi:hypothetical protein HZS_451 [Henneguya salminicola]|nr:hypothetical protein HZS_451 [Henneguya salminicola]